jgi:hypothetical protein
MLLFLFRQVLLVDMFLVMPFKLGQLAAWALSWQTAARA